MAVLHSIRTSHQTNFNSPTALLGRRISSVRFIPGNGHQASPLWAISGHASCFDPKYTCARQCEAPVTDRIGPCMVQSATVFVGLRGASTESRGLPHH